MVKRLLGIMVVVCFLASVVFIASAMDNPAAPKTKNVQRLSHKAFSSKLPKTPAIAEVQAAKDDPILWTDDFEGTQGNWMADANWNHTDAAGGGREFEPATLWRFVDDNAASPTHSWNATTTSSPPRS